MQLLILALAVCLFAHDQAPWLVSADRPGWALPALVVMPMLALGALYWVVCLKTRQRLVLGGAARRLRRLDRLGGAYRLSGLVLYALSLHLGLLVWVRGEIESLTGLAHTVLLDEVLVMLPPLVYWSFGWWAYYPIERRLREAGLIRQLDGGRPTYPLLTRWQYIESQLRHQVALILVPLLGVLAWSEAVELAGPNGRGWFVADAEPWLMIGGCGVIFLFAPLIIRLIWDTVPLPDGEIRQHLLDMCKTHRVGVRELLLWRTHGRMINAAVMGLIAPLRFILITDALLGQMSKEHVEAVMAHELAHVRKRHMPWLLVSAVGLMGLVETGAVLVLALMGVRFEQVGEALTVTADGLDVMSAGWNVESLDSPQAVMLAVGVTSAVAWMVGFGWVSRRVERQADSFAVAHLTRQRGGDSVEPADAQTMIDALQHVAALNHIVVGKHSWRHGSIAWRQNYLRSLVGQPVQSLPIDRQMRRINTFFATAVLAVLGLQAWLG